MLMINVQMQSLLAEEFNNDEDYSSIKRNEILEERGNGSFLNNLFELFWERMLSFYIANWVLESLSTWYSISFNSSTWRPFNMGKFLQN